LPRPDTKSTIAGAADRLFAQEGFADPGVDAVRAAADVSLRTLYKHFPSKEEMVVGALAHRHDRYVAFLREGAPDRPGPDAVAHLFRRIADWMAVEASRGCLFLQALAAHPHSAAVAAEVRRNKEAVRAEIARRLPPGGQAAVPGLFLLHEGLTAAAPDIGAEAAAAEAIRLAKGVRAA